MKALKIPETAELSIEALSLKGYGVATLHRPAPLPPLEIEVAHALAGDRVFVEMRKKMRGTRKGRLLEVVEPASSRVEPACPHARVCGGCCWQQMSYEAQLQEKEKRVREAFGLNAPVQPILAAVSIFRYRNKMEFTFSENRGGMRYLGLMIAQAEPYVYNTEECHLCNAWFSTMLHAVRSWWETTGLKAYRPPTDEGTLRYLTLRESIRRDQKMVILNISGNSAFAPSRCHLNSFVKAVQAVTGEEGSIFLRIHQTKKGKPTQFFEMHLAGPDHIIEELRLRSGTLAFKISPASFFQPNTLGAERLYDTALDLLEPLKSDRIFDLYCGTGTLSMAISRSTKEVIGIELSPEAVLDAEANAQANGIQNCTFLQGDVGKVFTRLLADPSFTRPDAVIVDPPRAGLDSLAIHHLLLLKPRAILYVSCNPLTQAGNIRELVNAGYRMRTLQPVDQFPHTYHIENIALLVR
jgi:23S rRNA (uracil1939-C5)-methyltransferase